MNFSETLPNFFIIGAAKAGTTSLFNILAVHPEVFGSPVKEPCFFSNDERFKKGLDWYQDTYFTGASGNSVRMEASPVYLTWSEKVAPRLHTTYSGHKIKFAAIFRDPVKRAYSHYWHRVRMGQETLSFAKAIQEEENRLREEWDELYQTGNGKFGYFRAGCYASRLRPYLTQFNRENFFFLLLDDLLTKRFQATIMDMLGFLEIDTTIQLQSGKFNVATKTHQQWLSQTYWKLKKTFLKPLYRKGIPSHIRGWIYNMLFPPAEYPPIDAEVEHLLRLRYQDEVKSLEDILQRDLSHWLPK